MPVTINANGLSIIHEDSGGKASATLPDVCLTVVGPSVVPIPYTNSAKSSDLADGSKTVTADGGNSIAIKGCSFSKSSGDAAGTNKGIVSGTTEGKAEFTTSSPTVKIEGKGVCRLSDQMTMNSMNTMCLAGADNDSVTVIEDPEGTYTVDLSLRYSDGDPVQEATYTLTDQEGGVFEGKLNSVGKASISGVAAGEFIVEYGEDTREFTPDSPTKDNPNFNSSANAQALIEKAKKGERGFWENPEKSMMNIGSWVWGVILGDFNEDASVEQIIANTAISMIPVVDQASDLRDLAANIIKLLDEKEREKPENWLLLCLTLIGCIPVFGSAVKGTCKVALNSTKGTSKDSLLAILRGLGKGDPEKFLRTLDWLDYAKQACDTISSTLKPCIEVATELASYAERMGADELGNYFIKLGDEVGIIEKMVPEKINTAMTELSELFTRILGKNEKVFTARVEGKAGKSSQAGKSDDVVKDEKDRKELRCPICKKITNKCDAH